MMTEFLNSHCLVELRNGERRILAKVGNSGTKILVNPRSCDWNYLSHWGPDGKVRYSINLAAGEGELPLREGDIVKIWGRVTGTQAYGTALLGLTEGRKLLWERKEARKMTVKEIEKLLGYEVEIVGESI